MSLVKEKKEAFVKAKRMGTHEASVEYKESRKKLKQGVRRAKRGLEISLASRIKENPKAFYTYIKSKRVARKKVAHSRTGEGIYAWSRRKWVRY